jgi:adenylylsulfate kinase
MSDIHPIFERLIPRQIREDRLGQKGVVLWFTGLSGSGKSTIAEQVEKRLFDEGKFPFVLDGDNVRSGLNNNLGFSIEDRMENIRRIAEVARLFKEAGIICICSFVSPTNEIRNMARNIIGVNDFKLIEVHTSLQECERRDVKGLYKKARAGLIKGFTGIDSPFERPDHADLIIETENLSIEQSTDQVLSWLNEII